MSNQCSQWSDFSGWPLKERYLVKLTTYKKEELVNLLKYNEFKIRNAQEELKDYRRERRQTLDKLKEIDA